MKKSFKLLASLLVLATATSAQTTLELQKGKAPLSGFAFGVSTAPVVNEFVQDVNNAGTFTANTPQATLSISLQNQQFTGLNYGTPTYQGAYSTVQTTGLVFGAGPSLSSAAYAGDVTQGASALNTYDNLGYYAGTNGPTAAMFTSSPTGTAGTGIKLLGGNSTVNGGVSVFTTAQVLFNDTIAHPRGSRVYFGDLVFTFSSPVLNPVIHVAGLGGSYRYLPAGLADVTSNYRSTFFTTELELANMGYTSSLLSGNSFLGLSGNNIVNNNHSNPNGASSFDATEAPFDNNGAATGSIRVNGVVKTLIYRIYLQGGSASQFAWSANGIVGGTAVITNAVKNPFTGDIWFVGASYDKPTQQISGNIFNDKDGITDNNINQSAGAANPKTNAGATYANLLNSSNQVVASTPVNTEGGYIFDKVPAGATYTVQLSKFSSAGTYTTPVAAPATQLPDGWVNTGDFIGTGAGVDASTPQGISAGVSVASADIKTDVNFGIERVPESIDKFYFIGTPALNMVLTLNDTLPLLAGSDPEDMPAITNLTGKKVQITTLPNNSSLLYAGTPVFLNQIIPSYNPALLQIKFTVATATGTTQFNYAYVDAAGFPDPTPALYRIAWPNNGPLPIILDQFTATAKDCNAQLRWSTATEINSAAFDVEVMSDDNNNFTKIGSVAAAGYSVAPRNYSFDYDMKAGIGNYFRLKMIKTDGTFSYSEIRKVSCAATVVPETITIAPNPVISSFSIKGMHAGKNTVLIYSTDGQLMRNEIKNGTSGDIDISSFGKGLYVVRILNENGTVTVQKIVKK